MEAPLQPLEPFTLAGPAGRIEGRFELPDPSRFAHPRPRAAQPRFVAVFGHPHPRYGGTMQNSVVVHGARALARLGGAVARFDFRGVGRSEGKYDEGRGELDDFLAVVASVRARWPKAETLIAAGFSFGSIRALECAARGAADAYLGVAPPIALPSYQAMLPSRLATPAALVLAGADELALAPTPEQLQERFADLRAVEVVAGASHLFPGRIKDVAEAIGRAATTLLPPT